MESINYPHCHPSCVLQSRARELDPQRQPGESDLQGAPASLLSGEGGFQQGQSVAQTHGAGERAQHQVVVGPSLSPPRRHLDDNVAAAWVGAWDGWKKRKENGSREPVLATLTLTVSSSSCCFGFFSLVFFFYFILII